MTTVTLDSDSFRLCVEGHAEYAPKGGDIVCAAASILVFTLAKAVDELHKSKAVDEPIIELDTPGYAQISCKPKENYRYITALIFRSICGGFEILAANHPENIRLNMG